MQSLSLQIFMFVFTIAAKLATLYLLFFSLNLGLFLQVLSPPSLTLVYMEMDTNLNMALVLSVHIILSL